LFQSFPQQLALRFSPGELVKDKGANQFWAKFIPNAHFLD
jgi:hypothetical protein